VAQHSSFNQKKSHNKTPNSLFRFHPLPRHFFNQKIFISFLHPASFASLPVYGFQENAKNYRTVASALCIMLVTFCLLQQTLVEVNMDHMAAGTKRIYHFSKNCPLHG